MRFATWPERGLYRYGDAIDIASFLRKRQSLAAEAETSALELLTLPSKLSC